LKKMDKMEKNKNGKTKKIMIKRRKT